MKHEYVQIQLRVADQEQASALRELGEYGVQAALTSYLLIERAAETAGRDDARCFGCLLEAKFISGLLGEMLAGQQALRDACETATEQLL